MSVARKLVEHVDVTGPRPVIADTDIKVSQVVSEHEHLGMSPDEIVDAHPHLSLGDVHAALAYYFDQPEDIRREWEEADALVSALQQRYSRPERGSVGRS